MKSNECRSGDPHCANYSVLIHTTVLASTWT